MIWSQTRNDNAMDIASLDDDALICYCKRVTKKEIKDAILKGSHTLKDVAATTGACESSVYCVQMNPNRRCCAIDIIEAIKLYKEQK